MSVAVLVQEDELRIDLSRHGQEIATHQSFNYAQLDEDETAILGCVYIDPPEHRVRWGGSWWVVDDLVGGAVERELAVLIPQWGRRRPVVAPAPLSGRRHGLAGLAHPAARANQGPNKSADPQQRCESQD